MSNLKQLRHVVLVKQWFHRYEPMTKEKAILCAYHHFLEMKLKVAENCEKININPVNISNYNYYSSLENYCFNYLQLKKTIQ